MKRFEILWKYGAARYRDRLLRIRIDTDGPGAIGFLEAYKETLKDRFHQIDQCARNL